MPSITKIQLEISIFFVIEHDLALNYKMSFPSKLKLCNRACYEHVLQNRRNFGSGGGVKKIVEYRSGARICRESFLTQASRTILL